MSSSVGIYASQISGHLSTNNFSSIATVTVGSGGASSITFSSIPSTYTHLQIRAFGVTSSNFGVTAQVNGDTATNYTIHYLRGDGSNVTANAGANTNIMYAGVVYSSGPGVMIMDILDYSNTNKYKTFRNLSGADINGGGEIALQSGLWRSTSAITSITFTGGTWNQYSSYALYGVK